MRKRDRSRPILNSSNLGTSHLLPTLHFPTLTSSSFVLQTHPPSPPHRFRPLQWAALNNRVAVASFLLDNGADVSLGDGDKQTALHWACVRGSLPCAELLLRHGAKCKTTDVRGYDAAHVAAQYGHTGMLYHFKTRWDADLDLVDLDGRSPLHWAAYKGFPDAVKLLLFCDCDALRQDKEGCTALHWAAIRGKSEAAHVLGQSGGLPMLEALDSEGSTAARLATDKGHKSLGHFLATTQVGISHAPRSASAIAHTRTKREHYPDSLRNTHYERLTLPAFTIRCCTPYTRPWRSGACFCQSFACPWRSFCANRTFSPTR
jgi:ankyrin repeat protein